jgi:hypothetical protein
MIKVKQWVSRFCANHLSHIDTWYAFNTTIMKTLEYPMIAILLSCKQWDKLMSRSLPLSYHEPKSPDTSPGKFYLHH